ncbi:MAG: VWA domain-containing protein [Alicyclobacillaceae bacterium]|nr:VWA domain-containing protein [Alicyclobacillaceae bacterium]
MSREEESHRLASPLLASIDANLLSFTRSLRRLGIPVSVDEEWLALCAWSHLALDHPDDCCAGLCSILVHRKEHIPLFEAAWHQFLLLLRHRHPAIVAENTLTANIAQLRQNLHRHPQVVWMGAKRSDEKADSADGNRGVDLAVHTGASRRALLRDADFAKLTEAEQQEMTSFVTKAGWCVKRSRRFRRNAYRGQLDGQQTFAQACQRQEVLRLSRRLPRIRQRPVVWIIDVSGSMEAYSRLYLRFAHALRRLGVALEVFVFSTRLTRVTGLLKVANPDQALSHTYASTPDFAGGTRLSETLTTFYRDYARRVLRRGSVLLLATDGFEMGDVRLLEDALHRLAKLTPRLLWLNPLTVDPRYTPTAEAAKVLLESSDEMVNAYCWSALEQLWTKLCTSPVRKPNRRQRTHVGVPT